MIGCGRPRGKHIFEIDPDAYTFNPRLHVVKTARLSVPVQCKHCENPACMAVCPVGAISQKEHCVVIDTQKCMGCKSCMAACPLAPLIWFRWPVYIRRTAVKKGCKQMRSVQRHSGGPACVSMSHRSAEPGDGRCAFLDAMDRKTAGSSPHCIPGNTRTGIGGWKDHEKKKNWDASSWATAARCTGCKACELACFCRSWKKQQSFRKNRGNGDGSCNTKTVSHKI